jgi:diguanylate cyclase (GGDEF)-like protein
MSREIADALQRARPLTVALMDIDGFGKYNRIYGWPTGDRVLRSFGTVARSNVRATDWVARYGGDEFVIVLPDTDLASAVQVLERVQQAYAATPIESLDGRTLSATISVGVAQLGAIPEPVEVFVDRASNVLKDGKAEGPNRIRLAAH